MTKNDYVYIGNSNHFQCPRNVKKIGKTQCVGSRRSQYNTSYPNHPFMYYMVISILIGSSINSGSMRAVPNVGAVTIPNTYNGSVAATERLVVHLGIASQGEVGINLTGLRVNVG